MGNDDSEGKIYQANTVPPPAGGDAYSAETVVREAPQEVLDAIREQREAARELHRTETSGPPSESGSQPSSRQPLPPAGSGANARSPASVGGDRSAEGPRGASSTVKTVPPAAPAALSPHQEFFESESAVFFESEAPTAPVLAAERTSTQSRRAENRVLNAIATVAVGALLTMLVLSFAGAVMPKCAPFSRGSSEGSTR